MLDLIKIDVTMLKFSKNTADTIGSQDRGRQPGKGCIHFHLPSLLERDNAAGGFIR